PEAARHAASICHLHPAGVVSGGDRRGEGDPEAGHLPRARPRQRDVLVSRGRPGTAGTGDAPAGEREGGQARTTAASFAGLVQAFFTDRLLRQRRASPHTVAGYRDTFRLLLRFAKERLGKAPTKLSLEDLDAAFVGDFLDHLEEGRGNGARSRNTRLAAVH